ncbi:hypothetical protein QA597_02515 [Marinilabiliaceae bacterium ANBcel2]|nr:hypothetical protein [Marinilabiliaceae bacterium ANBcel2]
MPWWKVVLASIFIVLTISLIVPIFAFLWPVWIFRDLKDHYNDRHRKKCIKAMSLHAVATNKPLPDWLMGNMIVYIESEYHPQINQFILENYAEILKSFESVGYGFICFPVISNSLIKKINTREFCDYHYPYLNENELNELKSNLGNINTDFFYSKLFADSDYKAAVKPGLIRKTSESEFEYLKIATVKPEDFYSCLGIFVNRLNLSIPRYKIAPNEFNDLSLNADYSFSIEANKLAKEIQDKIDLLKTHGYEQLVSNIILGKTQATELHYPAVSRLFISQDYRIYLTDYNNAEIELTPLPKTVFLFFLNHPEGVMFKFLSEYKEELINIYRQVSQREDKDEMDSSINDLVNPLSNSINEKCSRIKEAFVKQFSDDIARNYYIRGERGEPKKINIDRQMVQCETSGLIDPGEFKEPIRTLESEQKEWQTAYSLFEKREYFEAIKRFSIFIDKNPFHSGVFFYRAFAYSAIGECQKSESDNTRAIQLNHPGGLAYHNRAEDRYILEQYPEALEDIIYYIENFRDYKAESYFLKGLIYEKMEDIVSACKNWKIAKAEGDKRADQYLNKYPNITSIA